MSLYSLRFWRPPAPPSTKPPAPASPPSPTAAPPARGQSALADYRRVAPRVEAAAEAFCRQEYPSRPNNFCDFDLRLIDDPRAPPNAFQTVGRDGRPIIGITTSLLAQTGSPDEIAFVLSHEAGHHLANHLSRQQAQSLAGALIFGTIAAGLGGGDSVTDAMDLGAFFGGSGARGDRGRSGYAGAFSASEERSCPAAT
jgi:Zn-dependent protease with chaperone function